MGAGGNCPPSPMIFYFSAVGHGHDSTPTPLWFFFGKFVEVGEKKCVGVPPPPPPCWATFFRAGAKFYGSRSETFWQFCPPPPLSKHPGPNRLSCVKVKYFHGVLLVLNMKIILVGFITSAIYFHKRSYKLNISQGGIELQTTWGSEALSNRRGYISNTCNSLHQIS